MKRLASVEVMIGWSPRMSAEIPDGYALTDRGEHASEAKSVHQRACNQAMADLIHVRPTCATGKCDAGHDNQGQKHPHGQKAQWLDIWQAVASANKSGAP